MHQGLSLQEQAIAPMHFEVHCISYLLLLCFCRILPFGLKKHHIQMSAPPETFPNSFSVSCLSISGFTSVKFIKYRIRLYCYRDGNVYTCQCPSICTCAIPLRPSYCLLFFCIPNVRIIYTRRVYYVPPKTNILPK